jgi:hypothetical protein
MVMMMMKSSATFPSISIFDNKDDDAIYDDNDDNDYAMMMMTSLELVAIMLYGNVYNI